MLASRSFTLESSLLPEEILVRLAGRTRPISPVYAWTLWSVDSALEISGSLDLFVGQVTNDGFRVVRATWGGFGTVRPIISGSVAKAGLQTLVVVHVGYDLPGRLAVSVFVALPIVLALLLIQGFPPVPLVPVAVGVAAGILLAAHLVVLYAAERFRRTLPHLLAGTGRGA